MATNLHKDVIRDVVYHGLLLKRIIRVVCIINVDRVLIVENLLLHRQRSFLVVSQVSSSGERCVLMTERTHVTENTMVVDVVASICEDFTPHPEITEGSVAGNVKILCARALHHDLVANVTVSMCYLFSFRTNGKKAMHTSGTIVQQRILFVRVSAPHPNMRRRRHEDFVRKPK